MTSFWRNLIIPINPDGTTNVNSCWEWRSKSGTGKRAYTSYKNKAWSASRLAWTLSFGEIPDGLCVCHICDNPPCCNPNHLFLGTQQDNVDDRERKGRNKLPHSLGEEHGQSKLTEVQVLSIRKEYVAGETYRSLAKKYGVTFGAIRNIVKYRTWGWLRE